MGSIWGFPAATVTAFDTAYWLAQPTAVQALQKANKGTNPGQAVSDAATLAQQLMQQGYIIDVPIMVYGWDPYTTMFVREYVDGFSWVPSAGQYPGGGVGQVPGGAIKVSTNLADYPPFNPPAPPVQPPVVNPIGPDLGFQMNGCEVFSCAATDANPVGYVYTNTAGVKFTKTALGTELMSLSQRVCVWLEQPGA